MKALILYNPAAGRIPVRRFVFGAGDVLSGLGWDVIVEPTQSGTQATERAKQVAGRLDAVFAVGGDGTVGQVAAGLAGSSTALGILPAGTMNVFAAEMGLQPFAWNRLWGLEENIRSLAKAPVFSVDMGRCNNNHFLLWAGMGLDAVTIGQLEPRPRWDKFVTVPHYAAQTMYNAATWRGLELKVWADDREINGRFVLAIVSNIRKYLGGLVTLASDSYLDDGQMDLWLFRGSHMGDTVRHAVDMVTQRHLTSEDVQRVSFRTLRVLCENPIYLQMDGDPASPATEILFEVLPRALKLLIPERSLYLLNTDRIKTKAAYTYISR
jgi:diacylglycerol kinase (ATP)